MFQELSIFSIIITALSLITAVLVLVSTAKVCLSLPFSPESVIFVAVLLMQVQCEAIGL